MKPSDANNITKEAQGSTSGWLSSIVSGDIFTGINSELAQDRWKEPGYITNAGVFYWLQPGSFGFGQFATLSTESQNMLREFVFATAVGSGQNRCIPGFVDSFPREILRFAELPNERRVELFGNPTMLQQITTQLEGKQREGSITKPEFDAFVQRMSTCFKTKPAGKEAPRFYDQDNIQAKIMDYEKARQHGNLATAPMVGGSKDEMVAARAALKSRASEVKTGDKPAEVTQTDELTAKLAKRLAAIDHTKAPTQAR